MNDEAGEYALGAMLSDPDRPECILTRSSVPVLRPSADYELAGLYGRCVFSNGMVVDESGEITVYYGAADSICSGHFRFRKGSVGQERCADNITDGNCSLIEAIIAANTDAIGSGRSADSTKCETAASA